MSQQFASDQPSGFKNHITNVAIVGANGTVGKYITESLLATGKHTVTALTREGSTSKMPSGVKVAPINYDNPSTLVSALKGQDMLIVTLPTTAAQDAQQKLVDACVAAGVQWVMPNEYSPDLVTQKEFGQKSVLGPGMVKKRAYIADQGLNYIGLSSGFWYQYSMAINPEAFGFDIKNRTVTFIGDGETKISASTWAQSGRAVAAALSLPIYPEKAGDEGKGPFLSDFKNDAIYCHSFRLSQKDILASVLRVSGDKESDWTIKHEDANERHARGMKWMQEGNMLGFMTALYTPSFFPGGAGDLTARSHNKILGLPQEDLDEETKEAIRMVESGWTYH